MKLEETIQTILDNHSTLFKDRQTVLVYLFCYFCTGYEWIDGELVSNDTDELIKGHLNECGIAEQKLSEEEACIKYIFNCAENPQVSYEEFTDRVKEIKASFIEKGKEHEYTYDECIKVYEENILQPYLDTMRDIRNAYMLNVDAMLDKGYSPLYNLSKDIKEDWLAGAEEVKTILSNKK